MRILERIPLFCAESRPGFLARQPRAGMTETEPVGLHMVALFVERDSRFSADREILPAPAPAIYSSW